VYKWVAGNLLFLGEGGGGVGGCDLGMNRDPRQGGATIFVVASFYRNGVDYLGYWLEADLTFYSCVQKKF